MNNSFSNICYAALAASAVIVAAILGFNSCTDARSQTLSAASAKSEAALRSDPLMAQLLERAKATASDLVLVESSADTGLDLLSNLPRVLAGSSKTGDNILVQVVRNAHFDGTKKKPLGGWIQVDDKRYPLEAVASDSLLLFGYGKAPSREKIDALDFTVAICVDSEATDTDGKCLSFIETRYTPKK